MITILILIDNMAIWPLSNDHMNLDIDNKLELHTSSTNYEAKWQQTRFGSAKSSFTNLMVRFLSYKRWLQKEKASL